MSSTPTANLKVARSRQKMRDAGLRPVQFWVTDTRIEDYATQLRMQCLALKDDPAEAEVLRMTTQAASQVEGWA